MTEIWIILGIVAVFAAAAAIVFAVKYTSFKKAPRTVDDVIGMHCTVVERIDNYAGCGQVAVAGQSWSARGAEDDDEFEVGESLRIVAVEGVKLICMKN